MFNLTNKYVQSSNKLELEIFLNLCEEQGIKWVSGDDPRGINPSSDTFILIVRPYTKTQQLRITYWKELHIMKQELPFVTEFTLEVLNA